MSTQDDQEEPALRRIRERFEGKYGDLSGVMSAAMHWSNTVADFKRAWNLDMERPVTDADVDQAEKRMLLAVVDFAGVRPDAVACPLINPASAPSEQM